MDPNAFVYATYIRETPERVWQSLTDPALMRRYWRHQTAGPKTFHSADTADAQPAIGSA